MLAILLPGFGVVSNVSAGQPSVKFAAGKDIESFPFTE
jgi:hypothetical protein